MLEVLRKHGVPQVYGFVNAGQLDDDPTSMSILQEWLQQGYPLGNHTYSHMDLNEVTAQQYIADIDKNDEILQRIAGEYNYKYFRYPYLREGNTWSKHNKIKAHLRQTGYKIAPVSVEFFDWAWVDTYARCASRYNPEAIKRLEEKYVSYAVRQLKSANSMAQRLFKRPIKHILLLHIGEFSALMLDRVLLAYEAAGVHYISLDDAVKDPVYKKEPRILCAEGGTFLGQKMEERRINVSAAEAEPPPYLSLLCHYPLPAQPLCRE